MNSSSINQSPTARQDRLLEALGSRIRHKRSVVGHVQHSLAAAPLAEDIAGLEGRRNILQRHAPIPLWNSATDWACVRCTRSWPCVDWRDASAGLEEN